MDRAAGDVEADGATRLAGSLKVKEIYRQPGYPVVRLINSSKRMLDVAELVRAGLIEIAGKPPVFLLRV